MNNHIDEIYKKLFSTISLIADAPYKELQHFRDLSFVMHLKQKTFFLEFGQKPELIGYIAKGLLRRFSIDDKGNEFTHKFYSENMLVASFVDFFKQKESNFSIDALEDTTIIVLDYNAYRKLLLRHPCWSQFYYKILEKCYRAKERREGQLLMDDAKGRYSHFLRDYSGLESRIKQYHIASYLGISPISLSRIRSERILVE